MKQKIHYLFMLLLMLLTGVGGGKAQVSWVETSATELETGDVVVIVDKTSAKAMSNNNGTSSAPTATAVSLNNEKTEITSNVATTLQWVVTVKDGSYKFGVSGTSNYLYCTNSNNGVRVGINTNNEFTFGTNDKKGPFLNNTVTNRVVGVYSNQDWRCYTTVNDNIKETKTAFYKKVESGPSAEATTLTIDASGITNTDVYKGTAAGSLSATVKDASNNAVSDATVTWSGNNDNVATINASTGAVTLVAAGTVTFTASYAGVAGEYQASSATYEMTVTSSAPYVQPTQFDIALNNTAFGCATGNNGEEQQLITNEVTVVAGCTSSATTKTNYQSNHVRFYADSYLKLTAPTGYNIKEIVFTADGTWSGSINPSVGNYNDSQKTWTGEEGEVDFSFGAQNRISNISITLEQITQKVLTSISISGDYPTTFQVGDVFSTDGIVVTATYDNGSTANVTSEVIFTGYDLNTQGDQAVTVSYTEGDVVKTATYNITVNEYVQPTVVEVSLNNTFFDCDAFSSWSNTFEEVYSGLKNRVLIEYAKGSSQNMYIQTAGIRMYAGNSLTFVAPDGYNITGIKLSGETGFDTNLTAEGLSNGTWTGEASEVVIAGNSNKKNITAATITLAKQSSVKVPVFSIPSGTYYGPQTVELTSATEDATIKYSTDGETWIDYKSAITISETTTLYAKAVKGNDESAVVNATYTFPKVYTLGEMNAQSAGTYNVKFDKAVVTYVNGKFVFIEDATGAILFYNENKYAAKQVLDGIASVTWTLYSGQPEATAVTKVEGATFTTDGTVESVSPKVVTLAKLLEDKDAYISRFIKVEHVNAEASDKISQGDCELAFYGRNNAAVETGNLYDITGFLGIHQAKDADAIYQLVAYTPDHVTEIPTVAQVGTQKYETLEAAFAAAQDGETITLLADCTGNGIKAAEGKFNTNGLTVDFDGHTYTVDGTTVGSTGTETNGFQLLKDNKITFKGGTITSEKAKILIQNYSDLTLKGMTLTLNKADYTEAYTLSDNNGNVVIDGTTINANPAGGFAFDVCRYSSYPSVNVEVKGESVINGNIEISASGNDAKDGFGLTLTAGTLNGNIVLDASAAAAMESTPDKVSITKADAFETAAPEGYEWANNGDGTSTLQPVAPVVLAAPIIFHDSGEYESELQIAMAGEGTIMYTLNDGEAQTYSAPFTIKEDATIKAWAVKDGVASDVTEPKTFTIVEKAKSAVVEDGYYTIQNNDGKYVNVAGRKTVTLVNDTKSAGTVIRVKADEDGVKVLRSQAVDLPRYAERAMSYVPEIVKEVVKKLAANVDDPIIGEQGADLILDKFKKEFDYHLYLEGENNTYRIYGRTPSMKPVVDFYAENKELVDSRLPKVEKFVKEVLQEIVNKVGRGQSVVDMFKVKTIWQNMGGKLTDPDVDQAKFFEEVLSSEKNTWEFAYQTGMLYWEKVKGYLTDNISELGDYGKYIEKIPQIRPNFRYYIVPGENGVDIISEGNSQITDASTTWTLTKRTGFDVTFDATLSKNNGKEMYKTLYVDFAYVLPENVKALKVESVSDAGVAVTKEITGVVPAQTPVLLMSTDVENLTKTLSLSTEVGTPVTDNQLVGADYLINKYDINTSEVEGIFNILAKLSKSLADEYSYLKRKNAGTVNNKYFFGLTKDDLKLCYYLNDNEEKDCVVRSLSMGDKKLGFYNNWEAKANEAFLVSEQFNPVKLTLKGDVNRDGSITIADVTALVNIILGKATEGDTHNYDFEAAHVNADEEITIADVTALVNIILGK